MTTDETIEGRVAIVTGAGSGIGRATTLRLAGAGVQVFAIERDRDGLNATAAESKLIEPFACDVTDHDRLRVGVDACATAHGRIDILANIAGIAYYERHTESTLEHLRKTQAVNVEGRTLWRSWSCRT